MSTSPPPPPPPPPPPRRREAPTRAAAAEAAARKAAEAEAAKKAEEAAQLQIRIDQYYTTLNSLKEKSLIRAFAVMIKGVDFLNFLEPYYDIIKIENVDINTTTNRSQTLLIDNKQNFLNLINDGDCILKILHMEDNFNVEDFFNDEIKAFNILRNANVLEKTCYNIKDNKTPCFKITLNNIENIDPIFIIVNKKYETVSNLDVEQILKVKNDICPFLISLSKANIAIKNISLENIVMCNSTYTLIDYGRINYMYDENTETYIILTNVEYLSPYWYNKLVTTFVKKHVYGDPYTQKSIYKDLRGILTSIGGSQRDNRSYLYHDQYAFALTILLCLYYTLSTSTHDLKITNLKEMFRGQDDTVTSSSWWWGRPVKKQTAPAAQADPNLQQIITFIKDCVSTENYFKNMVIAGGKSKDKILFNSRKYVVRGEGKEKYILCKKIQVKLYSIRGKYRYVH